MFCCFAELKMLPNRHEGSYSSLSGYYGSFGTSLYPSWSRSSADQYDPSNPGMEAFASSSSWTTATSGSGGGSTWRASSLTAPSYSFFPSASSNRFYQTPVSDRSFHFHYLLIAITTCYVNSYNGYWLLLTLVVVTDTRRCMLFKFHFFQNLTRDSSNWYLSYSILIFHERCTCAISKSSTSVTNKWSGARAVIVFFLLLYSLLIQGCGIHASWIPLSSLSLLLYDSCSIIRVFNSCVLNLKFPDFRPLPNILISHL